MMSTTTLSKKQLGLVGWRELAFFLKNYFNKINPWVILVIIKEGAWVLKRIKENLSEQGLYSLKWLYFWVLSVYSLDFFAYMRNFIRKLICSPFNLFIFFKYMLTKTAMWHNIFSIFCTLLSSLKKKAKDKV